MACDDENNCPAGPALRGRLPRLPCVRFALYTACRGVKTPRKAVYRHMLSPKMASAVRTAPLYQHKCAPKVKQALFVVFWGVLAVPRKKARFRPILTHFEAIFGFHLAARGPTGQLWAQNWGAPSESTTYPGHFRWVSNSQEIGRAHV